MIHRQCISQRNTTPTLSHTSTYSSYKHRYSSHLNFCKFFNCVNNFHFHLDCRIDKIVTKMSQLVIFSSYFGCSDLGALAFILIVFSESLLISLCAAIRYFLCDLLTFSLIVVFCTSGIRKQCTRSATISSESN